MAAGTHRCFLPGKSKRQRKLPASPSALCLLAPAPCVPFWVPARFLPPKISPAHSATRPSRRAPARPPAANPEIIATEIFRSACPRTPAHGAEMVCSPPPPPPLPPATPLRQDRWSLPLPERSAWSPVLSRRAAAAAAGQDPCGSPGLRRAIARAERRGFGAWPRPPPPPLPPRHARGGHDPFRKQGRGLEM